MRAIDTCTAASVEANVRYMPPCQLPGYEQHVYTGFQLPYDLHEWDYNSWYDAGHPGQPGQDWYYQASGGSVSGMAISRLPPAPGARCARSATGSTPSTPPAGVAARQFLILDRWSPIPDDSSSTRTVPVPRRSRLRGRPGRLVRERPDPVAQLDCAGGASARHKLPAGE